MTRYCIFLTTYLRTLQKFRERYDPLARKVEPHVTLVHPFLTNLPAQAIIEHIKRNFQIQKSGFLIGKPDWSNGHITLPVDHDELARIRVQPYSGVLEQFLETKLSYSPHITIGRYNTDDEKAEQRKFALDLIFETRGTFKTLVLEKIREDECSEIVYSHSIVAGGLDEIS